MPPVPDDPMPKMTATDDLPWEEDDWDYGDGEDYAVECGSQMTTSSTTEDAESLPDTSLTPVPQAIDGQLYLARASVTGFTTKNNIKKSQQGELNSDEATTTQIQSDSSSKSCDEKLVLTKSYSELLEMVFVVEVTWSDGRTHAVKRTFNEFCNFHYSLVEDYAKSCSSITEENSPLTLSSYLPERQNGTEDNILLAEYRELQLNKYVHELIRLPPRVSACPTVLTFFESRSTDPKPYTDKADPDRMNVTDQYVICWIKD